MKAFRIEWLKFKNKRVLWILMVLPIVVLYSLIQYNVQNPTDYHKSEGKLVSYLSRDLGVQADYLDSVRGRYGPYNPNEETSLTEQQQENYQYFTQGETARFNYSVNVFNEDWRNANLYKKQVYLNLQQLLNNGELLFTLERHEVEETLPVIDWLIANDVDYVDKGSSTESGFVLLKAMPMLLGIFAMAMVSMLFGERIFQDLHTAQMKLMQTLPLSLQQVHAGKNLLFFTVLLTYVGGIGLVVAGRHVLFDTLPLGIQLTYPLTYYSQGHLVHLPAWQFIGYSIVSFILLSFILCYTTLLVDRKIKNYMLSLSVVTFVVISINLSDILWGDFAKYNVFKVFQTDTFLLQNSQSTIILTLVALFVANILLFYLNVHLKPKKGKEKQPKVKLYRQLSLFQFEWVKIKKFNTLVYSMIVVLLLVSYQTTIMLQETTANQRTAVKQLATDIDLVKKGIEQFNGSDMSESVYKEQLDPVKQYVQSLEEIQAAVNKGDYSLMSAEELRILEARLEYESANNSLFIPNAHINYQLAKWKKDKGVDFVPPGGPYTTEYLPTFEEINKFKENTPFTGMSKAEYDDYIQNLKEKHDYLSGINNAHYFITSYHFIVILVILVLFFSTSYAEEWSKSNPTIHLIKAQPLSLRKVFSTKRNLAMMNIVFVVGATLIALVLLGTILNGFGHPDFPVVQYASKTIEQTALSNEFIQIPYIHVYYRIVSIWQMITWGLLLLTSCIFFINYLIFVLSAFVKNKWAVLTLAAVIVTGGYLVSGMLPDTLLPYYPFVYLDIPNILNGKLSMVHNVSALNWYTGVWVQLVGILLLNGVERLYFRRRGYND